MHIPFAAFGLSLVLAAAGAQAQTRLPTLDRHMAGARSPVLVLGSVHLSGQPDTFRRESLEPLLERLAAFRPDVITVESMTGEQCDLVARHPEIYAPDDIGRYCRSTAEAKTATGLDVPAALAKVKRVLRDWPATPTPAQRRELAATFLAAGDDGSALVQWLRLPADERKAGDGLDATLVARLEKRATSNNESYSIGATLAARLGHERVYAVDDHTGDNVQVTDEKAYGEAVQKAWSAATPKAKPNRDRTDALAKAGDMLALYRFINRPDTMRTAIESDFGAALADASPPHYGRQYVGGWEARNLHMVANIRAAFRERPGARVLAIVGVSHKPWFDGLLGQMQGVDLVDVGKILK